MTCHWEVGRWSLERPRELSSVELLILHNTLPCSGRTPDSSDYRKKQQNHLERECVPEAIGSGTPERLAYAGQAGGWERRTEATVRKASSGR